MLIIYREMAVKNSIGVLFAQYWSSLRIRIRI